MPSEERKVAGKLLMPQKAPRYSATVLPDGRWLLYNSLTNAAVTLNASAGIFWELCDGQTSLADILIQLQEFYPNTPYQILEAETSSMLNLFVEQGLVVTDASS
jgi:hypothetical protein